STQQVINVSSGSGWGVFEFRNSLFWQNKYNGGQLSTVDIENSKTAEGDIQTVRVYNTIAMVGSGITSGTFDNSNIILLDPATDNLNLDAEYKPTSGSNYIVDQGDNTYYDEALFGDLDLAGNTRFFNTTIDLGAYEYDSTLGVEKVSLNTNSVTLYPNPVSDRLFIKSTETIKAVTIYNVNGQLIKEVNTLGKSIDVASLPSGLYFVKINTANGETTKKIIKN
ncbi:T9SS type A sorting domain-containing protein, partial [Corallibacter sp.]|uniref:T9SS type A sorting domain-containing protein n=1 Tax=Corallibacter sp. TaxID=2038084 RepID=UPI003AB38469